MSGFIPPNSYDVERTVLAGMLTDPKIFYTVRRDLCPEDFYHKKHREVFGIIEQAVDAGLEVSEDSVVALRSKDSEITMDDIVDIQLSFATVKNLPHYCGILKRFRLRRQGIDASRNAITKLIADECDPEVAMNEAVINALKGSMRSKSQKLIDCVGKFFTSLHEMMKKGYYGFKTGLIDLDQFYIGAAPGELVIVAGRPGTGKTAFGMEWALNVARGGIKVLVIEMEMLNEDLAGRVVSSVASVDISKMKISTGLVERDMRRMVEKSDDFSKLPIYLLEVVDANGLELDRMITAEVAENGIQMVILDYLQLADDIDSSRNRNDNIAQTTRHLKKCALRNKIPIVALSQMSREVEKKDRDPILSDLRDSGAIEQDANAVIFLRTTQIYSQSLVRIKAIVAKQRGGVTDYTFVGFEKNFTRFVPDPEKMEVQSGS